MEVPETLLVVVELSVVDETSLTAIAAVDTLVAVVDEETGFVVDGQAAHGWLPPRQTGDFSHDLQ